MRYLHALRSRLAAAIVVLAPTVCLATPLPFVDLRELLIRDFPEEVILAIVQEEGAPVLGAHEWFELQDLGASDRLLVALVAVAPPESPRPEPSAASPVEDVVSEVVPRPADAATIAQPPQPEPRGEFRAFYGQGPEGGQVFVLTNLDDAGQRLGGTADRRAPRNRVVSPEPPEAPTVVQEAPEPWAPPLRAEVTVAAPQPLLADYSAPPAAYVGVSPYFGFFYPYPRSHLYPPGSSTHNKLYHLGGASGFSHYQLPAGQVFYPPPFPGAGSHSPRSR